MPATSMTGVASGIGTADLATGLVLVNGSADLWRRRRATAPTSRIEANHSHLKCRLRSKRGEPAAVRWVRGDGRRSVAPRTARVTGVDGNPGNQSGWRSFKIVKGSMLMMLTVASRLSLT